MEITTVAILEDGSFKVNDNLCVPDDMGNRHRRKIQAWIDAGNTPAPFDPAWGDDLATFKAKTIKRIKMEGRLMFRDETDWYVIRKSEVGTEMPASIQSYRNQMRTAINDAENVINSLSTIQDVAAYNMVWPTKPGGV